MATVTHEASAPAVAFPTIRRRSLRHAVKWTALGTLTYSGAQAGVAIVLAKLGSAAVLGDYAFALAVASPITVFGRLGMRPLIATETDGKVRFQDYLAVQLLTAPICLVALVLVGWLGGFRAAVAWTLVLLGCAKLVESTGSVIYGLFDRHERQRRIAASMCIKGSGGIAALALAFWLTQSTVGAAAGLGLWWLFVTVIIDAPLASQLCYVEGQRGIFSRPRFDVAWRIIRHSFMVGLTGSIRELNLDLPYFFVRSFHGPAAMGFFAGIASLNKISRVIFRGFNQAASPRLAHYYHTNPKAFVRLSFKLIGICMALGLVALTIAATFGDKVLALIYRPEFANYQQAWVWLSIEIGFGLTAVALRQTMIAARYLGSQIPQTLLTTVVVGIACALLVPRYGVNGAAMACMLASIFDVLTSLTIFRFLFHAAKTRTPRHVEGSAGKR